MRRLVGCCSAACDFLPRRAFISSTKGYDSLHEGLWLLRQRTTGAGGRLPRFLSGWLGGVAFLFP